MFGVDPEGPIGPVSLNDPVIRAVKAVGRVPKALFHGVIRTRWKGEGEPLREARRPPGEGQEGRNS